MEIYPENSRVVFCRNKRRSLEPFTDWVWFQNASSHSCLRFLNGAKQGSEPYAEAVVLAPVDDIHSDVSGWRYCCLIFMARNTRSVSAKVTAA